VSDPSNKETNHDVTPHLIYVEEKKTEKKKVKKIKPRKAKSQSNQNRARSFALKFSPDLEIGSSEGIGLGEANFKNEIFEEGEADVSAIPVSIIPLPYPRRAKEAGLEGTVEMILLIDRKGKVSSIDFIKVPHEMFKAPIMKVVKRWKFKPAMNKGVPVSMRVKQSVDFNLEDIEG
jgi:TonB family protein